MREVGALHEEDLKKVVREIEQLQGRVLQTLVPTILAFGLIAFAGGEQINYLTLGGAFAVLFTSSLYVASLSYKIFRNSAFLQVFHHHANTEDTIYYENLMAKYRKKKGEPVIINAETTTASIIYAVLSFTFFFIFYMESEGRLGLLIATIVTTLILLCNCLIMFMIYVKRDHSRRIWEDVRDELKKK